MCGQFWKRKTLFVVVFLAWAALRGSETQAQQPITLPAGGQQMSPTDFAAAIGPLFTSDTFRQLSQDDQNAAKDHGEELFLKIDVSNTTLSYETLEVLHHLARYLLSPAQFEKTKTALLGRQDDWAGRPYADIRAKVVMMMRLEVPPPLQLREARRWVAAGGTQAQVPPADLKFDIVRQIFSDLNVVNSSFSVQWSGLLNAPQSGDYTFFISPININAGYNRSPVKFRMTVSVAGQSLLESTPENSGTTYSPYQPYPPVKTPDWTSQSKPVTLTAGQPVSLQVTVSADVVRTLPSATLHAMLFWQGPGVSKSLVPASGLTLANGSGPGLQATYSWRSQGQPQSLTRTDPMIDFAWTNSAILLSQNMTVANQAADEMWETMTSADYLTTLIGPPVTMHPFFKDPDDGASGLTTARRQAFLDLVLQNPTLLDPVDAKMAVRIYQGFRMGTPGKALDVFGAWAARHADLMCELSDDPTFDGDTSIKLAALAINTTQQLPGQASRLQNDFLQLPDGRCSLPVAYTLGYSYLGRGKASDWIAFLDAKLADPTVTGDLRVNWLIARATAAEFGTAQPRHYPFRSPFPGRLPLRGRRYLEQAIQVAQSPFAKLRAARELAGRLAWSQRFDAAVAILQPLSDSLPDAQKTVLAAWIAQLNGYSAAQQQYLQNRQANARKTYAAALQIRRDNAAKMGDTASVNRYNALRNAAQAQP